MNKGRQRFSERVLIGLLFLSVALLLAWQDASVSDVESRYPQAQLTREFYGYLDGVVQRTLPGPYIYRVLMPYTVATAARLLPGVDALQADLLLKVLLLFTCQWVFFRLLRGFYSPWPSLCGVLWFDVLTGYALSAISGQSVVETMDIFNALVIALALLLIQRQKFSWLPVLLFVGMLNRETPWIIFPLILLEGWGTPQLPRRATAVFLALAVPYFALHLLIQSPQPLWFTFKVIPFNIPFLYPQHGWKALISNLKLAVLIGPLLLAAAYHFRRRPALLRALGWSGLLFVAVHYLMGLIREWRLWLPLFIFWIPLALGGLQELIKGDSPHEKEES